MHSGSTAVSQTQVRPERMRSQAEVERSGLSVEPLIYVTEVTRRVSKIAKEKTSLHLLGEICSD